MDMILIYGQQLFLEALRLRIVIIGMLVEICMQDEQEVVGEG